MIRVLFLLLFVCGVLATAAGRQRQITGTVTQSADGDPIPGVTVQVKGTWTGVATMEAETDTNVNYIQNPCYKTKTNKQ